MAGKKKSGVCPNCGYCEHCGHAPQVVAPVYPWRYYGPQWPGWVSPPIVWSGTTTVSGDTTDFTYQEGAGWRLAD